MRAPSPVEVHHYLSVGALSEESSRLMSAHAGRAARVDDVDAECAQSTCEASPICLIVRVHQDYGSINLSSAHREPDLHPSYYELFPLCALHALHPYNV